MADSSRWSWVPLSAVAKFAMMSFRVPLTELLRRLMQALTFRIVPKSGTADEPIICSRLASADIGRQARCRRCCDEAEARLRQHRVCTEMVSDDLRLQHTPCDVAIFQGQCFSR